MANIALFIPLRYQLLCKFRLVSVDRLSDCSQSDSVGGRILSENTEWYRHRGDAAVEHF